MAITHDINEAALKIIEQDPAGVRWADLLRRLHEVGPDWHPKTVNGCVWKLVEKYPDRIYKPEKGLFRSKRYLGQ